MPNRINTLPRRLVLWIAIPVVVLLAARIAAPYFIRNAINARLGEVEGYSGRIEGVNLSLFRGAYQLTGVSILQQEGPRLAPLLAVDTIDFSLAWRELFRGRVVSDIVLIAPDLRLTTTTPPDDAQDDGRRWQEALADIFPIEIMHFEIKRGAIRFVDETSSPRVDLSLRDLELVATGLRNRPTGLESSPARLHAQAVTTGEGRLLLMMNGDLLSEQPHFTLKLDWQNVRLPELNDFLEAYASIDVSAGTLHVYSEFFARDGAFEGYVKPFFEDVSFENISDQNKGFARRLWETIVGGTAALLENSDEQQVATRIPFSGRFGDADVGVWATIGNLLRNGFIEALNEGRESEAAPENSAPANAP
jgi:hypothetical protein